MNSTMPRLMAAEFYRDHDPETAHRRSAKFRMGYWHLLQLELDGIEVQCPYAYGSVEYDAYFAGVHLATLALRSYPNGL